MLCLLELEERFREGLSGIGEEVAFGRPGEVLSWELKEYSLFPTVVDISELVKKEELKFGMPHWRQTHDTSLLSMTA